MDATGATTMRSQRLFVSIADAVSPSFSTTGVHTETATDVIIGST